MRYTLEHKKETHERIVRAASRQFRRSGRSGVSIAELMQELNLTHGGFYRHFRNKEQLFVEAFEKGLEDIRSRMRLAAEKHPGNELKAIIEDYLSLEHASHPEDGCPIAALAAEVAHCPKSVRSKIDRALSHHFEESAKLVPGATDAERLRNALVLGSGMNGAVTLARSVKDEKLRKNILDAAAKFYVEAFCR